MWRDSWIHTARQAGALAVFSCSGQGRPRRPDSAASLGYAGCSRLFDRVKGQGRRKLHSNKDLTLPHESSLSVVTMHAKARAFLDCLLRYSSATFETRQRRRSLDQTESWQLSIGDVGEGDGVRFALATAACECRCCRQPNRVSIAKAEYAGVWHLYFALLAYGCRERPSLLPFRRAQHQRTAPRHRFAENGSSGLSNSRGRDRCFD
jgi:hypothetical protein